MAYRPKIQHFLNIIQPPFVYTLVSLIVLGPLLQPGFILTLDMVFGPGVKLADWFYGLQTNIWGELPAWGVMALMNTLIPMWLVQKLLLFAILFIAGYSAHKLSPTQHIPGKYFSGLLYVLNPFVYVRFMAGQWQFLAGYAIAPLAIKAMISLAQHPGRKKAAISAVLLSLIGLFSPHMMVMILAAGIVILLFHVFPKVGHREEKPALSATVKSFALFIAISLILSFYWLLPAFTSKTAFLYQIGKADLEVFSAKPLLSGSNVFLALATLHGFWRGGYQYITELLPLWYLTALLFIFLAVHGFLAKYQDEKIGNVVKAMGVIGILSLLFASGASSPYFSPVYEFLFNKVFFLRAFRDSQKLVALLVLSYSYLGSLGVIELYKQLSPKLKQRELKLRIASIALLAIVLASPFIYSLNMLGGFKGQLKSVDYPTEWQEVNTFLNQQSGDFTVLFLPWHGFISLSWAGQRVATPAKWFFDKPVLQSQSLEVGPIDNESPEPVQHYIGFLIKNKDRLTNLGKLLAPLNIKYIILAKEVDYKEYDFLFKQSDLKVVMENSQLTVLENLYPVAMFYATDRLQPITGWEQLLEALTRQEIDTLGAVFPFSERESIFKPVDGLETETGFNSVKYRKLSPVRYELEPVTRKYVVASIPYDPAWKLDGVGSKTNLGITNSFTPERTNQSVLLYHTRYGILLFGYLASGTGLVAFILWWFLWSGKKRRTADQVSF
ncbi:MAG: hypothetical protein HW399_430 [Dehalococcoidia bacterium]|nr:hypothetical protein [Dehalococcoidia bacterium]